MPTTSRVRLEREILAPEVYEEIRALYLARMIARRRRRRVRVGPDAVVLFENHETVLAQLHEQLRAGGAFSAARALREAGELAPLLPRPGELSATLMIDGGPPAAGLRLGARLRAGAPVLWLEVAGQRVPAVAAEELVDVTCPVHYLRLPLQPAARAALAAGDAAALVLCDGAAAPLPAETRAELAADLAAASTSSLLAALARAPAAIRALTACAPLVLDS